MKNQILRTIMVALVALPLCLAHAQDDGGAQKGKGKGQPPQGGPGGRGPGGPPPFAEIDTDKSGDIDLAEWIKHHEERAKQSFKFLAGDDDKITEAEMKAMMERRGGPGGPGDGKGGPPRPGDKGKGRPGDGPDGAGQKPKRPAADDAS